ncbi:hypothetical protein SUGI_0227150 [Cryptomeria japonica]|nr:hypothetical protein SUGI_0227150 [Cryptomeria japonica]
MIGRVLEVDRRWSLYIHNTRVPRMFLKALEISGDGLLWIPATAALWLTPFSSFAIPKISPEFSVVIQLISIAPSVLVSDQNLKKLV